jgi:hypothetical protein
MEKRLHPRKQLCDRIGLDLAREEEGNLIRISTAGTGIDVSLGGMGIITDQALEKGRILKLLLPLFGDKIPVPVFSVIKWTERKDGSLRAGVQFLT